MAAGLDENRPAGGVFAYFLRGVLHVGLATREDDRYRANGRIAGLSLIQDSPPHRIGQLSVSLGLLCSREESQHFSRRHARSHSIFVFPFLFFFVSFPVFPSLLHSHQIPVPPQPSGPLHPYRQCHPYSLIETLSSPVGLQLGTKDRLGTDCTSDQHTSGGSFFGGNQK